MKSYIIAIALLLSGCQTTNVVTQYKTVVIKVPDTLLNCPYVTDIPKADTLTNQEVATFIKTLYRYNKICHINMEEIKKFLVQAEKAQK